MVKLIILDRDGVINQDSSVYVKTAEEWLPIPGSIDAIVRLYRAGYTIVIATNQSGLGRGLFNIGALDEMHSKLAGLLLPFGATIAEIFYCPHSPEDLCGCRKPASGLLDQIAKKWATSLAGVPFVGDSLRDLRAGLTHRCMPILVRTGKGAETEKMLRQQKEVVLQQANIFDDLAQAADHLCAETFL
jgi:D-glycero-D-manno-heptose 1,7-bisphosphate phosphatase|tara:strand:+ start:4748 stop:5311 length:564 start_codon:yes stop_codon:yes gene_type:complete